MIDKLFNLLGYYRKSEISGVMVGTKVQKDLDYVYEKIGCRAHKVSPDLRFNGFMKTVNDKEAEEVEELLYHYSKAGYIFTKEDGTLIGNVSSITTKDDRVQRRRLQIKVVPNAPD